MHYALCISRTDERDKSQMGITEWHLILAIGDCGLNPHRKDAKDAKKGKTWVLEFFATLRCKNSKSEYQTPNDTEKTGYSEFSVDSVFFGVRLVRNPKSKWGRGFDYPQDRKDEGGTGSFVGLLHSDDDLDFGAADSLRMDGFLRV